MAEQAGDGDVGGAGGDLEEGAHHLRDAGEVDALSRQLIWRRSNSSNASSRVLFNFNTAVAQRGNVQPIIPKQNPLIAIVKISIGMDF